MKKLAISLLLLVSAQCGLAADAAGIKFEQSVNVEGIRGPMVNVGAAVKQNNFVPLYVAALYVPVRGARQSEFAAEVTPKRFDLEWLMPGMDPDRYRAYWRDSVRAAMPDDVFVRNESRVEHFEYLPDEGIRVYKNGKKLANVFGVELIRAILNIWLAEDAENQSFRNHLLGFSK